MGAVSLSGELLVAGGGPRPAVYHLRTLSPVDPEGLQLPSCPDNIGSIHVLDIFGDDNRIIVGGELQGKMYQTNLTGQLLAEIDTSCSCLYSAVHWCREPMKVMALAGSSSKIDLCTANFSYRDRSVVFPAGF